MEGDQSEIVGNAASCSAVVPCKRTRVEWCGDNILSKELKDDMISVSRKNDPVMSIELGIEEIVVNIMCV